MELWDHASLVCTDGSVVWHDYHEHGTFFPAKDDDECDDDVGERDRGSFTRICPQAKIDQWTRFVELAFAVFFLVDAGALLYQWRLTDMDLEEELGEVLLNLFGYLFLLSETAILFHQKRLHKAAFVDLETGHRQDERTFSASTADENAVSTGLLASLKSHREHRHQRTEVMMDLFYRFHTARPAETRFLWLFGIGHH